MRWSLAVLCCVLAGVSGYVVKLGGPLGGPTAQPSFATAGWLQRQKMILELFENVCEDSKNPMIIRMANEFSLENALAKYSLTDLVTSFRNLYEGDGLLPKGEVFSEYNKDHLEELRLMYNLLYYANNFDIFYSTAAWARQNVNCGIFLDALYAAVVQRKDTEKIAVPAPYEILPNYFVQRDAIAKAIILFKNNEAPLEEIDGVHIEGNVYTVDVNYTGAFIDNEEESKISYFREDVGLNTFYYFMQLRNAHWLDRVNDGTNRKGEYWYYIIRQMNARYNLERVTNGLKEIEDLSWRTTIDTPYDPMLMYNNGKYYPERTNNFNIDSDDATYLIDFENHISSMVQQMGNVNKTFLMNTIFDLLSSEDTNYEWTARRALSSNGDESRMPSALEHYATTLRDPVYWRLNKRLLNAFNVALNVLQPYAHNQLYFPGVEIMNIEVKKMQTYFDYFQFDVTNSVTTNAVDSLVHVNIGQPRLNHKPFSIMINVASLVAQKALVKIFIGPKFNLADIGLIKDTLKQLDSFEYNLNVGTNKIVRKSNQINNIAEDYLSLRALLKRVEAAELGLEPLYFTNIDSIIGYPSRLILPKGTADGFPLQLYVIIAPFVKTQIGPVVEREFNTEILSYGYPFDRPIEDPKLFDLANTMFKDILITHKGDDKVYNYGGVGASKKWYSTGAGRPAYDPEPKPTYGQSTEYKKFDYTAKKGNYEGKTFDYTAKKGNYKSEPTAPIDQPIPLHVLPIEVITTTETVVTNSKSSEILDKSENTETSEGQDDILTKVIVIPDEEKINNSGDLNIENIHPVLRSSPYDYTAKKEKTINNYLAKKEKQEQKIIKIQAKKNSTVNEVETSNIDLLTPITAAKVLPIYEFITQDQSENEDTERQDGILPKIYLIIDEEKIKDSGELNTENMRPALRSSPYDYTAKKEKTIKSYLAKKEKQEQKIIQIQAKKNSTVNEVETSNIDPLTPIPAAKVLPTEEIIVQDQSKNAERQDGVLPITYLILDEKTIKSSEELNTDNIRPMLRSSLYDYTAKKEKAIKNYLAKKEKQDQKRIKIQAKKNSTLNEVQTPNLDPLAPITAAKVLPIGEIIAQDQIKKTEDTEREDGILPKINDSAELNVENTRPVLRSTPYDYTAKKEKTIKNYLAKKEKQDQKRIKIEAKKNSTLNEVQTPNLDPLAPITAAKVLPIGEIIAQDQIKKTEDTEREDGILPKINDSAELNVENTRPVLRSTPYDYTAKKEKTIKNYLANKEKHELKRIENQAKKNSTVNGVQTPNVDPLIPITVAKVIPIDDIIVLDKSKNTETTEDQDGILPKIYLILDEEKINDSGDLNIENIYPLLRSSIYDYTAKKEKAINNYTAKKEKQEQKRIKIQANKVSTINEVQTPNVDPLTPTTVAEVLPIDGITIRDEIIADPNNLKIIKNSESSETSEDVDDVISKIKDTIQKQTKDSKDIKTKDWHPTLNSGPYDYVTKKEKRVNESIAKKENAIDKHETKQLKYQTKFNRTETPIVEPLRIDGVIKNDNIIHSKKTFKKQDGIASYDNVNMDTDNINDYEDLNQKFNRKVISNSLEDSDSTEAAKKYYNIRSKENIPRITENDDEAVRYVDELDYKKPLYLDDYITWIGLHHVDDDEEERVYY